MFTNSTSIIPTTPPAIVANDLVSIARQIADEHDACCKATSLALRHAVRAGELLVAAKAECPHGSWSKWIAENCEFSERTARSYMQLARHRAEIENGGQSADLRIDNALKLLAKPKATFTLPDLDGTTAYVSSGSGDTHLQLWPHYGSRFKGICYYAHYLVPTEDGGATEHYCHKPMTAEGILVCLERWGFEQDGEWSEIAEPVLEVDEWKPRWPERHSIEKEIDAIIQGPCSPDAALRLREIRDRRLWVGCFASFDSYVHQKWGLDADIVDKTIGIVLARGGVA